MITNESVHQALLNLTGSGIVIVDAEGVCLEINDAYLKVIGKSREEIVGSHIHDFYPNSRLPIVAKTGLAEVGKPTEYFGQVVLCSRTPIYENGKVVGAVGSVLLNNLDNLTVLQQQVNELMKQISQYQEQYGRIQGARYSVDQIIGHSEVLEELRARILRAAQSPSNVLITGESGTGKELAAHAIHQASLRADKPFISINCGAIPSNLLESELFGYEDGSFTGGRKGGKEGLFMAADKGTLFLDEIGEMPFDMQVKLLRVLQEGEVLRIGAAKPTPVDCRILAATNRDLVNMVQEGSFRLDLYYRLNVMNLNIPPLRKHTEDLSDLICHIGKRLQEKHQISIHGVSKDAMMMLRQYEWPGNVRELENVIERASALIGPDRTIDVSHLPSSITHLSTATPRNLKETLAQAEKDAISNALYACHGRKSTAARLLGISRPALYEKMKKYEIDVEGSAGIGE